MNTEPSRTVRDIQSVILKNSDSANNKFQASAARAASSRWPSGSPRTHLGAWREETSVTHSGWSAWHVTVVWCWLASQFQVGSKTWHGMAKHIPVCCKYALSHGNMAIYEFGTRWGWLHLLNPSGILGHLCSESIGLRGLWGQFSSALPGPFIKLQLEYAKSSPCNSPRIKRKPVKPGH